MRKTAAQKIATLESRLAKIKATERRKRTRRLIELGAMFEKPFSYLESLTPEQQAHIKKISTDAITIFVQKQVALIKAASIGGVVK